MIVTQNQEPRTKNSPPASTQHSALSTSRLVIGSVVLITLVGLGLRVYAIGHGLPYQYVPDESTMVGSALRMGASRSLQPPTFIYPALQMYLFAAEYLGLLVVGRLTGLFTSIAQFREFAFVDPTLFYLLPRFTMALAGTATIPLAYLLGRRLYGSWAGVAAAALIATSLMHVQMSHQARHWVPVTLLALVALWVSLDLSELGRRRDYRLSGLLVGLAAATSFGGLLLMILPLAAHVNNVRRRGFGPIEKQEEGGGLGTPQTPPVSLGTPQTPGAPGTGPGDTTPQGAALGTGLFLPSPPAPGGEGQGEGGYPGTHPTRGPRLAPHVALLEMLLLVPVVFFALNPFVLLQADRFVAFQSSGEASIGGQIRGHYENFFQQWSEQQGFAFFAEATLAYEPAIALLGIAGAVIAGRRFRSTALLVLIYPIFHYLMFASTSPSLEQRYMLPAVALWALPAGLAGERALAWLYRRLGGASSQPHGDAEGPRGRGKGGPAQPLPSLAIGAVALLFATLAALPSLRYDWLLSQTDTRTLAKLWIEQMIPAGEDVAMESYGPPLSPNLETLRAQQRAEPNSLGARDLWLLEKGLPRDEVAYRLTRLNLVDTSPTVDRLSPYLETNRHRYFVISDFRWKAEHLGHGALKAYLARNAREVATFSPSRDTDYVPSDLLNNMEDPLMELWKVDRPGPRIVVYEVSR